MALFSLPLSSTLLLAAAAWTVYVIALGFRRREQWRFYFQGREMIKELARRNGHKPFSLPVFGYGGRMHIVSSPQHWEDIKNAGGEKLSLQLWVKSLLQPQHSFYEPWQDTRTEDGGMPIVRAIRTMSSTARLDQLKPLLLESFERDLSKAMDEVPKLGGYSDIPLTETLVYMMIRINCLFILGYETAQDVELVKSCIAAVKQVAILGEAGKLFPTVLTLLVKKLVRGDSKHQRKIYSTIVDLVQKRQAMKLEKKPEGLPPPASTASVLEAFVDSRPDNWTTKEIVYHVNILFTITNPSFGGTTTQFLKDLYRHRTSHPAILSEIRSHDSVATLPGTRPTSLLESVLMESFRTHCFQLTATHRAAVSDFAFSDGYVVPAGQSVQFYQAGIHLDQERYKDAERFDPERFRGSVKSATDIGMEWPFWGVGKNSCPGRFFFTSTARLLASWLLTEFDCELKNPVPPNFHFGESSVPSEKVHLYIKRKPFAVKV